MAIDKEINPTVLNEENQVPLGQENMSIALEAIRDSGTDGFEMQEDGSAILGETMTEEVETDFDSNLAEVLDDQELRVISNELIAGIEKDKASGKVPEGTIFTLTKDQLKKMKEGRESNDTFFKALKEMDEFKDI